MPPESSAKICKNCSTVFTIEPDDFGFYEKIDVPAPTFCPDCRLQRRLAVRNERNLYKRECGLCKASIISMYSSDKPFPVYCAKCWWGDKWDPMSFGQEYDFSRPFFEQMRELQNKVPRVNLNSSNTVNSDYCNYFADGKNCYLCFGSIEVEDCLYGSPYESKYCVDTYLARECEYCYEAIDCEKLSQCAFVQDCANSFNLLLCFDCKNSSDCIGCVGLRNKQYHILNQPYPREEFLKIRQDILARGHDGIEEMRAKFLALKLTIPHRFATILQNTNVTGDHVVQSKNAQNCFDVKLAEDCAHCIRMIHAKDSRDTNYCEYDELCYEYIGNWKVVRSMFSNTCGESSDVLYSDVCFSVQNLFGCVCLRNKSYCILNKQYTKEEYQELLPKIIAHMKTTEEWGEFFPIERSLLNYNETVAQEFFPLTEAEAKKKGYGWQPSAERNYTIGGDVIACEHGGKCNEQCTTAFKLIPAEIQFYQRMNLPMPALCPNCRHYARLQQRNPLKLWHRKCTKCGNEFETSYSPERPEIVYCESCYQAEVI